MLLTVASILVIDYIGPKFGLYSYYYMINNAQKLFAVTGSVSMFMWFKNFELKQSKAINTIASATFGVLLIHANSNQMRQFLWCDLLKNTTLYASKYLAIHAIFSVASVYFVCVAIELLRIKVIEKTFLKFLEKTGFFNKVRQLQSRIY